MPGARLDQPGSELPEERPGEGGLGLNEEIERLPPNGEDACVCLSAHPGNAWRIGDQEREFPEEPPTPDLDLQIAAFNHY